MEAEAAIRSRNVMRWIASSILFLIWLAGVLFHKGGFLHLLLLSAIAIALVQIVAWRRARQG